jgi:hypothetical protein
MKRELYSWLVYTCRYTRLWLALQLTCHENQCKTHQLHCATKKLSLIAESGYSYIFHTECSVVCCFSQSLFYLSQWTKNTHCQSARYCIVWQTTTKRDYTTTMECATADERLWSNLLKSSVIEFEKFSQDSLQL